MFDSAQAPDDARRDAAAARRTRLRRYQEQLLERVQAARTGSGARTHQLGVEIGGAAYLLDLAEAGEIVPVPVLSPVPLTRPWYLGLASIRGNLVGVVDLAGFFAERDADGAPAAPAAAAAAPIPASARIVTLAPGLGLPCGLLATRVAGLRQAADMRPLDAADDDGAGGRLVDAGGKVWTPLALAALARDERFLQVAL
ncbi:chemotaxis protein CheW [Massilia forsythiae]|uniref:Chemotaxis protein CheW n=1 Tax=Massilia forsythiae TaxID=2728020 RepID=A0A7Z2VWH1_9BURK|nr:chemotaxis protein CheW [Massilia forsythiae]QJE00602.1 chemotaxis protein CheW [Massilia forsythiae]